MSADNIITAEPEVIEAPKAKRGRPRKADKAPVIVNGLDTSGAVPKFDGRETYGDSFLFGKARAHSADSVVNLPEDVPVVRPGDLVYESDPSREFRFIAVDDRDTKYANQLKSRLRRRGYFEVREGEFVSPNDRYPVKGGVFRTDDPHEVWYAQPHELAEQSRQRRFKKIAERVSKDYASDNLKEADDDLQVSGSVETGLQVF